MPFHLNSHSRRRFLQGAAILALEPLGRKISAAGRPSETWALLSDTHIDADPAKFSRQGVNMADNLRRVLAEVMAERDSLTGLIIDGDCAYDDGQPGDYTLLLELLAPLRESGLPIHFTLGNHDDRDSFYGALENLSGSSPVVGKHCSLIETPLANWVLLDSLRFVNKVEGEIGEEQLAWVARILDNSPGKPALIVGHHYPQVFRDDIIPGEEKIKISGLVDSGPLLETIASRASAKAYIYGHSHTWLLKNGPDGLHQINLPPTAYVFSPERPSGWVRATITETGLTLELRSLEPAHPAHGEQHHLAWR